MNKVAFIITVYKNDKLEFFKQAIESIVNQDYGFENINIYLAIDGDITTEIDNYITENKNYFYKIVKNKKNKGLAYSLNRLIEVLENEKYIFRMDADDICRVDRVSKQLEVLKNDKELLLLGSDVVEIDENNKQLRLKVMPTDYKVIKKYSISRNPLNHPTIVFKREFFDIVGLYNEKFLKSQDYELWARALKRNIKISNINEALLYFRVTSKYFTKRNSFVNYINEFKISIELMNHFKMYSQFPKILAKLLIRIAPSSIGKIIYKLIRK